MERELLGISLRWRGKKEWGCGPIFKATIQSHLDEIMTALIFSSRADLQLVSPVGASESVVDAETFFNQAARLANDRPSMPATATACDIIRQPPGEAFLTAVGLGTRDATIAKML